MVRYFLDVWVVMRSDPANGNVGIDSVHANKTSAIILVNRLLSHRNAWIEGPYRMEWDSDHKVSTNY